MPLSVAQDVADRSHLKALHDYPNLRIIISEGSIGWVPYLMERADFANNRHKAWTHSLGGARPSEDLRPVTSGDVIAMSRRHAEGRTAAG